MQSICGKDSPVPYVILSITLAAFVAAAIYLIVTSSRLRLPPGLKRVIAFDGMKITVVTEDDRPDISYVIPAMHACRTAWPEFTGRYLVEDVPELVIHFTTHVPDGKEGIQTYVSSTIGRRKAPMLVIKEKHVPTAKSDPLIAHELSHVLGGVLDGDPDREHDDPRILRFVKRCEEAYPLFILSADVTARG